MKKLENENYIKERSSEYYDLNQNIIYIEEVNNIGEYYNNWKFDEKFHFFLMV